MSPPTPVDKPEDSQHRPGAIVMQRLMIWSDVIVFLGIVAAALVLGPHNALWFGGLTLTAAAFLVWMVARRQLGKSFMAGAHAKQFVGTGLYRRFKHPIYYFGTLAHLGAFVALQNWWILGAWIIYTTTIQWTRMKREDRVLEEAFGDEFRRTREGTWV